MERIRAAVAVAILGLTPGAAAAGQLNTDRGPAMNEATTAAVDALKLPDAVFYSPSNEAFDRLAAAIAPGRSSARAGETPVPPVFALGFPRVIDVAQGPAVPGALLLRYQGLRRWEVNFNQNLAFIVVDLHTGVVESINPFQLDKLMVTPPPSRSGPGPSAVNRNAVTYGAQRFLLPGVFGDTWPSTAFAVTAIVYDWISNTAVIERRPPPDLDAQPFRAPSAFIGRQTALAAGPTGLTVAVEVTSGGAIPISVSLALPRTSVTLGQSSGQPDSLVMVAELLLVRLDAPRPVMVPLVVPVTVRQDAVVAAFSFDLAQRPEGAALAGEYQVYLVSGRTISPPAAMTVTRR